MSQYLARISLVFILILFACCEIFAQDLSFRIEQPLVPIKFEAKVDLTSAEMKALIQAVIPSGPVEDTYYVIHIVQYVANSTGISAQKWYVYFNDWAKRGFDIRDPRTAQHFKESRIFGSNKVVLVYAAIASGSDRTSGYKEVLRKRRGDLLVKEEQLVLRKDSDTDTTYTQSITQAINTAEDTIAKIAGERVFDLTQLGKLDSPPLQVLLATLQVALNPAALPSPGAGESDASFQLRLANLLTDELMKLNGANPDVAALPDFRSRNFQAFPIEFLKNKVALVQTIRMSKPKPDPVSLRKDIADAAAQLGLETEKAYVKMPLAGLTIQQLEDRLADAQAVRDIGQTFAGLFDGDSAGTFGVVNENKKQMKAFSGMLISATNQTALTNTVYRVDITKKIPAPKKDAEDLVSLFGANGEPTAYSIRTVPIMFAATGPIPAGPLPADMLVTLLNSDGTKETEISKNTFDNEKKYWYDVSVGLPMNTSLEVTYDETAGAIVPRKVNKINLYGMFNAGIPRDTKHPELQILPAFLYGMAITGQPLKHQMVALSVGLNKVSFFYGMRIDQKTFVLDLTKKLTPDNEVQRWSTHRTYGINLSVSSVTSLLKKQK